MIEFLNLHYTVAPNNHHSNVLVLSSIHLLHSLTKNDIHKLIKATQSARNFSAFVNVQRNCLVQVRPIEKGK